ncbi:MAG TPA: DUF4097 family beta strand repeat-containing protein [Catenuloplanes sp.]|jgi:hypothetical protein
MALQRTAARGTRLPSNRAARATGAALATAAVLAATGCGLTGESRLDFTATEKVKITSIVIGPGGSGSISVRTADIAEARIKRVVRYRGEDEPGATYRLEGTVLHADTECGRMCSVSYDIEAPTGVTVSGEQGSGDVTLTNVAAADVKVGSGSITLTGGAGTMVAQAGSGNIAATDLTGALTLKTGSGDITGHRLGGAPLVVETGNGNMDLALDRPAAVRAHTGNGNVTLTVPQGRYQVRATTKAGEQSLGVPNDPAAQHLLEIDTGNGNISLTAR